jgi:predicted ArsR family transcriptional regulator
MEKEPTISLNARPLPADGSFSSDDRRDLIIEELRRQDEVTVSELSALLGVSDVTIRKDLQQLEDQGYLTRVRGGAWRRSGGWPRVRWS